MQLNQVEGGIEPAGSSSTALLVEPGHAAALGDLGAEDAVVQLEQVSRVPPASPFATVGTSPVVHRDRHPREIVDRAARPDTHARRAAHHVGEQRLERPAEVRLERLRSPSTAGRRRTNSAVSRPTPSGRLSAQRRPAASPIISSTLPPPMSMHERGRGVDARRWRAPPRRSAAPPRAR